MSKDKGSVTRQIQVSASEEIRKGVFSNNILINHKEEEFLLDFMFESPSGMTLNARVILTPKHFKRFVKAVTENLMAYESNFGKLPESSESPKGPKGIH
jgi:hypothetical protein